MKYSDQIPDYEALSNQLGMQAVEPDLESGPLLEALKQVKEWKPAVQRGRREWDDQKFYESLSRQFGQKKQLSPKQRESLKKMVRRYAPQVANYSELAARFNIVAPVRKQARHGGAPSE